MHYPETKAHFSYCIAQGRHKFSDLVNSEKQEAVMHFLAEYDDKDDIFEFVWGTCEYISKLFADKTYLETFKDNITKDIWHRYKTTLEEIFDLALKDYFYENPGHIISDEDDWLNLDNAERAKDFPPLGSLLYG